MPEIATDVLARLFATIEARSGADPARSHTAAMLAKGPRKCAEKFGEEAVETVMAAVSEDRDRLIGETADLLYHLLVVLEARGVTLAEVEAALARRASRSGLDEKASRKGG